MGDFSLPRRERTARRVLCRQFLLCALGNRTGRHFPAGEEVGRHRGRPEIQKFAGELQGQRANKGVFITTSDFSRDAHDYVNAINAKIILIDGRRLAQLMVDHNVGVAPIGTYELKRVDSDYFEGE